jgi:hypothetical protein
VTRLPRARALACALAGSLLVALGGLAEGCSSTGTGSACDCADPQVTIAIPADIASSITVDSITLSGAACAGVTPSCTNQTNGCTAYSFTATAAGECDIAIAGAGVTFQDSLTIVQQTGCCAGFYPATPGSAQVQVPEPGDAG